MLRAISRNGFYFCSAVVSPNPIKNLFEGKEETGWDRVLKIFKTNEYEEISPEMANIYNTTIMTAFVGAMYGGFIHSRDAYLKFIENNEASRFVNHFEAKKQLQDSVTKSFGIGALRWSWRLAMFGGMYVTGVSILSAYRGSSSIFDYVIAGCMSGLIYRVNYGLNGMVAGATLGTFIGLLGGSITMMILRFSGNTLDDVSEWHKEHSVSRERHLKEAMEKSVLEGSRDLLIEHDRRIA